jgi:hypothetical protein
MLNRLIAPEILDDAFYLALTRMAQNTSLKTYLEIGSSSGEGSTKAFVSTLRSRPDREQVKLFCMELSVERYLALKRNYSTDSFVYCYNLSSVLLAEFPTEEAIEFFYKNTTTNLNLHPLELVLGWLREDIKYLSERPQSVGGIDQIKAEHNLRDFDFVLIDGSEFTGERELLHVLGAKVIALDDVNAHKCLNCYNILNNHVSYSLVSQELQLRNGFAIFERRY